MFFEANGKKFVISWKHVREMKTYPSVFTDGVIQAATRCSIFVLTDIGRGAVNTPVAAGLAECSTLDQYDRDEGRKRSLTRALRKLYPTKDVIDKPVRDERRARRRHVWNIYHLTMGKYYRKRKAALIAANVIHNVPENWKMEAPPGGEQHGEAPTKRG